jgi:hypothetical protein
MKKLSLGFVLFFACATAFGQGQVMFANRLGTEVDAPVLGPGLTGLGPAFSAQLMLVGSQDSLTPLLPITTFQPPGIGAAAIADRYWVPQTVEVPGVQPGEPATFVVRAWETASGDYWTAFGKGLAGQSLPFSITVGGGAMPAAKLTTLQAFTLVLPEPSVITLGMAGTVALLGLRYRR